MQSLEIRVSDRIETLVSGNMHEYEQTEYEWCLIYFRTREKYDIMYEWTLFFFQHIKAMYSNPGLDPLYLKKTDFSKVHVFWEGHKNWQNFHRQFASTL